MPVYADPLAMNVGCESRGVAVTTKTSFECIPMATNSSPSFFVVSAAEFDGTTPLTTDWTPNVSPRSQPRSYASPTLTGVGRISYAKLGQPGSKGSLVIARTWSSTAVLTLTVRSETAAENTAGNVDAPAPNNLDAALITRALTTDWCAPFPDGSD